MRVFMGGIVRTRGVGGVGELWTGGDPLPRVRAAVRDAIEQHLRYQPTKESKSRVKRLRGLSHPQYRLRVGDDIRVFYDGAEEGVQVLAIVPKSEAEAWLEKHGESDETSSSV